VSDSPTTPAELCRAYLRQTASSEGGIASPHLKASWGGGTPVSVTVYFTKDSAISPNKAISAQLIEESDEGFYIVGPKESRAIFVPRSSVALV
jgi:hypothetical protein